MSAAGREYALLPVADDVGQSSIGWSSAAVMDLRTRARPGASTLVGHSSQLLGRLTGTPCGSVWFSCHREVRALGGRTEMRIDYVLKRVGMFVILVWVAATLNFFAPRLTGKDPVKQRLLKQA